MTLTPESSPERLIALYRRDAGVHPYALADLDLYWDVSTWWMDGDTAVGLMRLPSTTTPIAYAVSSADPTGTLRLIRHLIDGGHLPDRFVITGPDGLRDAFEAAGYTSDWHYNYTKFALTDRGGQVLRQELQHEREVDVDRALPPTRPVRRRAAPSPTR